jgi:hypothetical protein
VKNSLRDIYLKCFNVRIKGDGGRKEGRKEERCTTRGRTNKGMRKKGRKDLNVRKVQRKGRKWVRDEDMKENIFAETLHLRMR